MQDLAVYARNSSERIKDLKHGLDTRSKELDATIKMKTEQIKHLEKLSSNFDWIATLPLMAVGVFYVFGKLYQTNIDPDTTIFNDVFSSPYFSIGMIASVGSVAFARLTDFRTWQTRRSIQDLEKKRDAMPEADGDDADSPPATVVSKKINHSFIAKPKKKVRHQNYRKEKKLEVDPTVSESQALHNFSQLGGTFFSPSSPSAGMAAPPMESKIAVATSLSGEKQYNAALKLYGSFCKIFHPKNEEHTKKLSNARVLLDKAKSYNNRGKHNRDLANNIEELDKNLQKFEGIQARDVRPLRGSYG